MYVSDNVTSSVILLLLYKQFLSTIDAFNLLLIAKSPSSYYAMYILGISFHCDFFVLSIVFFDNELWRNNFLNNFNFFYKPILFSIVLLQKEHFISNMSFSRVFSLSWSASSFSLILRIILHISKETRLAAISLLCVTIIMSVHHLFFFTFWVLEFH